MICLYWCVHYFPQEMTKLKEEIAGLRTLLQLHGITDDQNNTQKTSKGLHMNQF